MELRINSVRQPRNTGARKRDCIATTAAQTRTDPLAVDGFLPQEDQEEARDDRCWFWRGDRKMTMLHVPPLLSGQSQGSA
jgi:hypothetical protein